MSKPSFFGTFVQTPRIGAGLILAPVTGATSYAVTARRSPIGSISWPLCGPVTGVTGVTAFIMIFA